MLEQCVVITKDADFVDSFFVKHQPWKLLLVSTGNIRNTELLALFVANMEQLLTYFDSFDFIEVSRTDIIIHL